MMKRLRVVLVCGLGIAFAGCGSDAGVGPGATPDAAADAGADVSVDSGAGVAIDVGILPAPVLDPNGTYGGKTLAEWGAEWQKWIWEYPGPESLAFNTPGAYCGMGQSMAMGDGSTDASPFFLAIFDFGSTDRTFTQACTLPVGRTILFPLWFQFADNIPGCTSGGTEANCLGGRAYLSAAVSLELEIDGKPYGSQVADFAPYLTGCTHFSGEIPNTPENPWVAYYGCTSTEPILEWDAWQTGYWITLAPPAPGPHTIHFRSEMPGGDIWDVTYDLTVADTTSLGGLDGGTPIDATSTLDTAQHTN